MQNNVNKPNNEKLLDNTHVGFDVEVLEVECVLPDVDADDGDVGQKGVLVGSSNDFQTLGRGVQTLRSKKEH